MSSARRLLTVYYLDRRGRWQQRGDRPSHHRDSSELCHDGGAGSDPSEEEEEAK
jgi:hypothetical protein